MKFPFEGVVAHCSKLNLRISPSTNADVVDVLTEGTRVDVERFIEQPITGREDWYEVSYHPPGRTVCIHGFVVSDFIELIEE